MQFKPRREVLYVLYTKREPRRIAVNYHRRVILNSYPDVLYYNSYVIYDRAHGVFLTVVNYRTRFAFLYPSSGFDGRVYYDPPRFREYIGYSGSRSLLNKRFLRVERSGAESYSQ